MPKPRISQTKLNLHRGPGYFFHLVSSFFSSPLLPSAPIYTLLFSSNQSPFLFAPYPRSLVTSCEKMRAKIEEKFSNFFELWMSKLEENVHLLLALKKENKSPDQELHYVALVNRLTQHHKDYFTAKWACAHEDVLAFYTPVWLSPLENAYQWITGWKPSMIFRLVDTLRKGQVPGATTVADLSEEQAKKIESLRGRIRMEEEKVEREMERQQVAVADRKMAELARLVSLMKNGEQPAEAASGCHVNEVVDMAVKEMLTGLEKVMKMADCVRLKTLKGVLDVLSPMQSADFLASVSMLHIRMRKWGKKRDKGGINERENFE